MNHAKIGYLSVIFKVYLSVILRVNVVLLHIYLKKLHLHFKYWVYQCGGKYTDAVVDCFILIMVKDATFPNFIGQSSYDEVII